MFPFLSEMRLLRQWAGITDMTSDYSPIMGLSPVDNYYLDAGWGTNFVKIIITAQFKLNFS